MTEIFTKIVRPEDSTGIPTEIKGPVMDGERMYLHREDLMILASYKDKMNAAVTEIRYMESRMELMQAQHALQLMKASQKKSKFDDKLKLLQVKLARIYKSITEEYGVDMKTASYDDETGMLKSDPYDGVDPKTDSIEGDKDG